MIYTLRVFLLASVLSGTSELIAKKGLIKIGIVLPLLVGATGCSTALQSIPESPTPPPTNTSVHPTETQILPTFTPTATLTNTPTLTPTSTVTRTPTLTPTPVPTLTPTPTPTETVQLKVGSNVILKYLVHKGTGGTIGCGDSLIPVSAGQIRTGNVTEDVKLALNSLFSTGTEYVGDLYNPLYQSKLRVAEANLKKSTKNMTVHLTGSFTKPKDDCDKLLYRAQVWDTVRQFPEVKHATIWLNKYLLGDLLVVGDN
jgi:hypothetical protein